MNLLQPSDEYTRQQYIAACILANITVPKREIIIEASKKWDDDKQLQLLNSYKQKAKSNKTTILK